MAKATRVHSTPQSDSSRNPLGDHQAVHDLRPVICRV